MQELKDLGLTDGEIKVYLALLELGPSTNSPIANKTRMQASSVYYCLNSLINKGFVSYVIKSNRKHFEANDPDSIPEIINDNIKKLEQQKKKINSIVPKLKLKQTFAKKKSLAVVYEGFNGLKTIFNNLRQNLNKGESFCAFAIGQKAEENKALQLFFQQHNRELKKKGIKLKLLSEESSRKVFKEMYGTKFLQGQQELKYTKETIPSGVTIWRDNVVIHVWDGLEPMSFMITNPQVAENYQKYFNSIWKKASP
jgi:HTH-type transcriptional regulator, sugar sensing transcriptional regulator